MGQHNEYRLSLQIPASLYHNVYRYASSDIFQKQIWTIYFCKFSHTVLSYLVHFICLNVNIQLWVAETISIETRIPMLPPFFFLFFLLRILRLQKVTTTEQKKTFLITIMILLLKSWIIFRISYSCELLEHFYIFEEGEREILHCIVNTNHEKVQGNLMSEKDTRFWLSQPMLYVLVC